MVQWCKSSFFFIPIICPFFQACFGGSSILLIPAAPGVSGSWAWAPPCGERGETAEDRERGEEQAQVRHFKAIWDQRPMTLILNIFESIKTTAFNFNYVWLCHICVDRNAGTWTGRFIMYVNDVLMVAVCVSHSRDYVDKMEEARLAREERWVCALNQNNTHSQNSWAFGGYVSACGWEAQ